MLTILKKKKNLNYFRENKFSYENYKKIKASEEMFSQLGLWMVNLCLHSYFLHLLPLIYPIFTCVDPDPQDPEYGSNLDSDPQHWVIKFLI